MSDELRTLIVETQEAFRADPAEALATFESVSSLGEGFRSEMALRDHRLGACAAERFWAPSDTISSGASCKTAEASGFSA